MLHCNFLPAASNNTLTPFAFVACHLTLKTKHFKLQYCTLLHQYCTKCAILHTKIGPGKNFTNFRQLIYTIYLRRKFIDL